MTEAERNQEFDLEPFQFSSVQFSSVQLLSHVWLFQTHGLQHARLSCPSPTHRASSNSCPLSQRCHPITSSSVIPFFSCLQSFPASESFLMSQFFASGGPRIVALASVSVLPMNIQDWFPLGLICLIFLQSKGLSRVLTLRTLQFFLWDPVGSECFPWGLWNFLQLG